MSPRESARKRKPHTKSRRGCTECKIRHLKCSETLPVCSSCERFEVACIYPTSTTAARTAPSATRVIPTPSERDSPSIKGSSAASTLPIDELSLLYHWMVNASITLSEKPLVRHFWQDTILQLGFKHHFLLDGILGFSAVHKAAFTSSTSEKVDLLLQSTKHTDRGLEVYQQLVARPDPTLIPATFTFGTILVLRHLGLAQVQEPADSLEFMYEWMALIAGMKVIVEPYWQRLHNSEVGVLIHDSMGQKHDDVEFPQLMRLRKVMNTVLDGTDQETLDEKATLSEAIDQLQDIYGRLQSSLGANWNLFAIVMHWPSRLSSHFRQLFRSQNPIALILLDQFADFVQSCENDRRVWYAAGWSRRMKSLVRENLTDHRYLDYVTGDTPFPDPVD